MCDCQPGKAKRICFSKKHHMPDVCLAYDVYEAYEVWRGIFLTPSAAGNSFHRCVNSFHRCGGPPPSRREVWGFRRSRFTALPSIAYRGFAVAPMTLRAPSRNLVYNSGCRVATLLVSKGVMGFLGDLRGRNSKSPPNPLGLAERVLRPQRWKEFVNGGRHSRSGNGGKGFRIVGSEKNGSNRVYGDFRFATDGQQAVCLLHDVCKLRIAIPLNPAIGFDIAKQAR